MPSTRFEYLFVRDRVTYADAETGCVSHGGPHSKLASISNVYEQEFLTTTWMTQ